MENITIKTRVKWLDSADYRNNIYRCSVRINFNSECVYRSFSFNIAACGDKEAKKYVNGLVEKYSDIAPVASSDAEGFDRFFDAVVAEVKSDERMNKYFV